MDDKEDIKRPLYVKGDIVYRATWDRVEEGEVIRVERCNLDSQGRTVGVGKPDGQYILHTAKFGLGNYESQTYEWVFFKDIEKAYARLAYLAECRINEINRDLKRWNKVKEEAVIKAKGKTSD